MKSRVVFGAYIFVCFLGSEIIFLTASHLLKGSIAFRESILPQVPMSNFYLGLAEASDYSSIIPMLWLVFGFYFYRRLMEDPLASTIFLHSLTLVATIYAVLLIFFASYIWLIRQAVH